MSKNRPAVVLNLPVEFSGVTIGEGVARIGFRVRREHLNINAADDSLCGRRLTGRAIVTPAGDSPSQTYIEGTDAAEGKHEIYGAFDVKRFFVSPKWIASGLTFSLEEIELKELGFFSKRSGYLVVSEVGEIPAKAKKPKAVKVRASKNGKTKKSAKTSNGGGDGGDSGNPSDQSDGAGNLLPVRSRRVSPKGGAKRRGGVRMMAKPR